MSSRGIGEPGPVVVTGGSGFVGRAVVGALLQRRLPVVVADKVPYGDATTDINTSAMRMITGDLNDPAVREAAVTAGTSGIIHLAAATSVLKSKSAPAQTFADNVEVTQGLLELARIHRVPRFVFASTNAVVGDVGDRTITTNMAIRPLTPYGATKAACEMLLSGYAGSYGLGACALRFTNVYGPGMAHKDNFVARMMRGALTGGGVQIYGDGTQRRDMVYLTDVVAGLLGALESDSVGAGIIGGGESVTVLDMVETARKITRAPIPAEHVDPPAGEMPAVIVDLADSAQTIGYRPLVTFVDGLAGTWDYFHGHAEHQL
jgi:UDP-glucose 4-epimerase